MVQLFMTITYISLLQPCLESYLLARMLCPDGSQTKEKESHNRRVSIVFIKCLMCAHKDEFT